MDRRDMRGGLDDVKESPEEMYFVIGHMGTMDEVRFKRGATEARITKKVAPFIGMMVAMHSFPR